MAKDFEKLGVASLGGLFSEVSETSMAREIRQLFDNKTKRAEMAAKGVKLIDGKGAGRLANEFKHMIKQFF